MTPPAPRPPVPTPLPVGAVADPVEVPEQDLERRLRAVLDPPGPHTSVVWQEADSEAIFRTADTRARAISHGLLLIGIVLQTVETQGPATVTVPFAIARRQKPAGMTMASERKPRGAPILVDRWGEAAIAVAFGAVVDVANAVAGAAGEDDQGAPLMAGAIFAEPNRLVVVPQARHLTDRAPN